MEIINFYHGVYKGYEYIVFYSEQTIMAHYTGYVKIPSTHPAFAKVKKQRWFNMGATAKRLAEKTKNSDNPFPKTDMPSKRYYRYDYDALDLNVHGGLTFGEWVTKRNINNWFQPFTPGLWVGWDYSHAGDEMYLPKERAIEKDEKTQDMYAEIMAIHNQYQDTMPDKVWKWDEVERDCKDAIRQLIRQEKHDRNYA